MSAFAYEDDVRFKKLFEFVAEAGRRMKKQHTGTLSKEDEKLVNEAKRLLTSVGMQMQNVYTDQPGLIPDVPTRKAVQETWNKTSRSGAPSKSGTRPIDPLRS